MTENQAFNLLVDLLADKGRLKIITSQADPDRVPGVVPADPHYFILHDVVKIEKSEGKLVAHSEEGDWCRAKLPSALLARLTEHERWPGSTESRN